MNLFRPGRRPKSHRQNTQHPARSSQSRSSPGGSISCRWSVSSGKNQGPPQSSTVGTKVKLKNVSRKKLAVELSIAEQLSTVTAAKWPEEREMLRDANWTIHKLGWLKRQLSGEKSAPALDQSTSFGTYCAALAERLSAIAAISSTSRSHQGAESGFDLIATHSALPSRVAQQLAEEERDLSLLFCKYKEEKLQELAGLLAHKTLQMGSSVRRRSRSKF